MVRPLSQTGHIRVPRNAKQRPFDESGLKVKRPGRLEALNDSLEGRSLHPTKGYRTTSLKSSRASILKSNILAGGLTNTTVMRAFLLSE